MVWGWRARLHERSKKTPTQLHTLRATRTSATCAQSCGRAGRLRIVDEEFEMLLLLKGVVHLNLLFEHQVVLDDCSADSGCFGRLQFGQPLAKPDERVCRGLPSERAVCVCEAVSVEKRACRRPLPAAVASWTHMRSVRFVDLQNLSGGKAGGGAVLEPETRGPRSARSLV